MATEEKPKLLVRNRKSATALMAAQQADLNFIPNPHKDGSLFFECGTVKGYISPKVKKAHLSDTIDLEKLQYCETCKPGEDKWVPCLMMASNTAARSFKYSSLMK